MWLCSTIIYQLKTRDFSQHFVDPEDLAGVVHTFQSHTLVARPNRVKKRCNFDLKSKADHSILVYGGELLFWGVS